MNERPQIDKDSDKWKEMCTHMHAALEACSIVGVELDAESFNGVQMICTFCPGADPIETHNIEEAYE